MNGPWQEDEMSDAAAPRAIIETRFGEIELELFPD